MTAVVGHEVICAVQVVIGVDTHQDEHMAVAIDQQGVRLAQRHAPATSYGYWQLERWSRKLGEVRAFGVEGTGYYYMEVILPRVETLSGGMDHPVLVLPKAHPDVAGIPGEERTVVELQYVRVELPVGKAPDRRGVSHWKHPGIAAAPRAGGEADILAPTAPWAEIHQNSTAVNSVPAAPEIPLFARV